MGTGAVRAGARWPVWLAACCLVLGLGFAAWRVHVRNLEARLVADWPSRVLADPVLVHFALGRAPALYAAHCAACHGRDLRGNQALGAPDLADSVWLYGSGQLPEIEDLLRYGIRSGHPKAHNITDMPDFGRTGQLSPQEIHDVVEYIYAFTHRGGDPAAIERGRVLYQNKGNCYDCHGSDVAGNADYGAPDLTGRSGWLYGGDRASLTRSVRDGRHGLCPAWGNVLTAAQLRSLAIYLYLTARNAAARPPTAGHTGS